MLDQYSAKVSNTKRMPTLRVVTTEVNTGGKFDKIWNKASGYLRLTGRRGRIPVPWLQGRATPLQDVKLLMHKEVVRAAVMRGAVEWVSNDTAMDVTRQEGTQSEGEPDAEQHRTHEGATTPVHTELTSERVRSEHPRGPHTVPRPNRHGHT